MTLADGGLRATSREAVLARFRTGLPSRFEPATGNPRLHGALITTDEATGRATAIRRLAFSLDELEAMRAETRE